MAGAADGVLWQPDGGSFFVSRDAADGNREIVRADLSTLAYVNNSFGTDNIDIPEATSLGIAVINAPAGNTVYVTGSFSQARPAGVAVGGAGSVARSNLLAYDITTGKLITTFSHTLNAQGLAIAASPNGSTIYVVGDFTTVDGQTRSRLAAFDTATFNLSEGDLPERVFGAKVSADLFPLLGVQPIRGRAIRPEECAVGRDDVILISERLWRRNIVPSRPILPCSSCTMKVSAPCAAMPRSRWVQPWHFSTATKPSS